MCKYVQRRTEFASAVTVEVFYPRNFLQIGNTVPSTEKSNFAFKNTEAENKGQEQVP